MHLQLVYYNRFKKNGKWGDGDNMQRWKGKLGTKVWGKEIVWRKTSEKAERLTWQLLKSHEKVAMKCKNAVCLQGIIWCHCFTLTIHQHSFNLLHFYAQKQLHTGKGREGNMKLQYAPQTEHFAIGCLNNQCTTISFFITPYIWVCSHPLLPEDVNAWENGERLKD